MKEEISQEKENNYSNKENEIDLILILNFLIRNKFVLFVFGTIFFITGCLYALSQKRVWEGEFQIVLNSKNKSLGNLRNSALSNLIGPISGDDNNINTQVGILESPSVLMPIFEYSHLNKSDKKRFKEWRKKNLKINLKEGTSILNISYQDTDKDIILPVLTKMSSIYQEYSSKTRKSSQDITGNYLKSQIALYQKKSFDSLKKAQEFSIDQDLFILINPQSQSSNLLSQSKFSNLLKQSSFLPSTTNIERIRVDAANQIKVINYQIQKLEEIGNDTQSLRTAVSALPNFINNDLIIKLNSIEDEIISKKLVFTKNDREIKNIEETRKAYLNLIKDSAISYLKGQKIEQEATLNATKRPKGVIIRYKELIRKAERDEQTLVALEDQLRAFELDYERQDEPWKLITNPTLNDGPVAPKRKVIGLLGLITGLLFGILYSKYKENKSNLIYESSTLEKILKTRILEKINITNNTFSFNSKDIFLNEVISNRSDKSKPIIFISNLETNYCEKLLKNLFANDFFYRVEENFSNLRNDNTIIFISKELPNIYEIRKIENRLSFLNISLFGIILIKDI